MSKPFLIISQTKKSDVITHIDLIYDDPFTFGMIFVDAARTIAKAFSDSEGGIEQAYLDRIKRGFDAEWAKHTTDIDAANLEAVCICGHSMGDHIEGFDPCSLCDCKGFSEDKGFVECPRCGGSGFSQPGTGYDDVCSECGGLRKVRIPVAGRKGNV